MSHVYTGDEIVRKKIPSIESFQEVIDEFRDSLMDLHSHYGEIFPAATIFGGCAKGSFNICSDIDIMMLVNDTNTEKQEVFAIAKEYSNIWVPLKMAESRFVKVTLYPVFMANLLAGEKRNDKQFLSHVVKAAKSGGLICGDNEAFEQFYALAPENTLSTTLGYIERKKNSLERRLFCYDGLSQSEVALMYLDAYQSPFHALRRVFNLWGAKYEDSKLGLISALTSFAEVELKNVLSYLCLKWKEYVMYVEGVPFHSGIEKSPLSTDDVQKSLFALSILHMLTQKEGGRNQN